MAHHPKEKRGRKQRLAGLLALFLALLMLLSTLAAVFSSLQAGAASVSGIQSEINTLKEKNKDLVSQKAGLRDQLTALQSDKSQALAQKGVLERQMGVLREEIDNLDQQLDQYQLLILEKEAQVAENEAEEEEQFALFCRQVRAMEEEGVQSYWSILFSAESYSQLLDRVGMVNAIAAYNDLVCTQLQDARAALEEAKGELLLAQEETQAAKAARESAQGELEAQEAQVQTLIDQIAADQRQTQLALDELNAAAQEMDAEIAKKEKELEAAIEEARRKAAAGQGTNQYQFDPGTGFYWPLPSRYVSVNSFFGPRSDPFTGKSSNHSGTDIGAPSGTEIYAAHGGVVLTSAYHNSYGNYVVLSRGDGVTTLYAHMSRRGVNVGDVVSQGQVIGYVGSTGRSTGAHLHFEVRVDGVRQDALKYYPNINWKNNTGFAYER